MKLIYNCVAISNISLCSILSQFISTLDSLQRFRVSALQTRVSQLRKELFDSVIQKLVSKSYVEESITTTRKREVMTEVRLVENNPAFRHVQECLRWIEAKQNKLDVPDYGTDLPGAQLSLEQYGHEHLEVVGFKKEIDKCKQDRVSSPCHVNCVLV